MNAETKKASKALERLYKRFRASITAEQWQKCCEEIKQAQFALDGKVLEGAELEAATKANAMARLMAFAKFKGVK